MKNLSKTTLVAIGILLIALSLTIGFTLGKIDVESYSTALAAVGAFGAVVIGWLASDSRKG